MPDLSSYEEKELLERLAGGRQDAFEQVFRAYYSAMCVFANKITAAAGVEKDVVEDLVGEVFERLWNKHPQFDNTRHLRNFLYKATRNACFNYIKKESRLKERQGIFISMQLQSEGNYEPAADLDIIRMEVFRELYREIATLPDQCGKIVRMGYIDGLSNEEIAVELGLSLQTVKNQKSRGLSLLRSRLSPELFVILLLLAQPV